MLKNFLQGIRYSVKGNDLPLRGFSYTSNVTFSIYWLYNSSEILIGTQQLTPIYYESYIGANFTIEDWWPTGDFLIRWYYNSIEIHLERFKITNVHGFALPIGNVPSSSDSGATGPQGPQGETGAAGIQGAQGATGIGWTGAIGAQGVTGASSGTAGSGTAGYIPYWSSASTLGDSILYYDTANSRIGLGTTTPERKMEIRASGSGNTVTYALRLTRDDG